METASIEIPLGVSVIDGKVYFKVEKKEATKAYLAGTFNNWDPQSIEMKNVNGYWQVSLELNPGKYQYKFVFIINDNQTWQEDPFAPGYVPDGFGGKNGIFELVEQDGSLVILKPEETSSQSSSSLSGNYSFTLTYKYDQDIILKGYGFDNSLNLIFKPSDELEFSLKYSGATIDNAKLEFSWQKLNLMAHYNLPLDLAIEGISSGVFVNYDNKFFVDIGALNDVLPFLLWVRFGDFSVYYGNKYFYGENAIFAGYDFEFSSIDFELFGGYFVESSNFAISINTNSKNWNSEFSYVNNIISLNIDVYGWEIFGNYSMLDSSYEISLSAPLFEIYKIFGGYRHSSLIDKSHIGFGLFEDDYSLRLKIRTEASNIFLDIFGEINF
ncbi:MAG: isoamylase early set domain-containing protein [Thermosipho sp. (in: Bacteria)]|nr:isoamylase early set domain-containing protein [Thermosipho sp. (in: thermotogales)]